MNIQEAYQNAISKSTSTTARTATSLVMLDLLLKSEGVVHLNNRLSFETIKTKEVIEIKVIRDTKHTSTIQYKNGSFTLNKLSASKSSIAIKLLGNIIKSNLN